MTNSDKITHLNVLGLNGDSVKVGATTTVYVGRVDTDGYVTECHGESVPSAEAGYAVGCVMRDTNASGAANIFLVNEGSTSSCSFVSAAAAGSTIVVADESTDTTCFPAFFTAASGALAPKTDASNLTYNSNTGVLAAASFTGALTGAVTGDVTGNVTGNVTGSSGSCTGASATATGNAGTATALATPRTIGGVSFNGTANIVPQTIQVLDTADTSTFVALFEDATGSIAPKTDTGLTYNAGTGTLTATVLAGSAAGITATTLPPNSLPAVPTDMGAANITIDLSNSNSTGGAKVTNIITDGSVTAASFSGSASGITANTLSPAALPLAPTDMGNGTITVDLSNSNGANVTNLITDGSMTASSFSGSASGLTAGSVKASALQSAAADLGAADVTVNLSNTNAAFVTNVTIDGTMAAGILSGSGSGLTANSVSPKSLPAVPTDMGNATITVDLSNSNGANVTNLVTDGTVAGSAFIGSAANLTANTLPPSTLPNVPTDMGNGTITVDISNSNGANVTNLVTDGSVTAGSFSGSASGLTAGSVKASALQAAPADLGASDVTIDLSNTNGAFVTNLTTDGTITSGPISGTTIAASDTVTFNGTGNNFGNASTDTFTFIGRAIMRNVTDAGPMTATAGTKCEVVYCNDNDKVYVCTASGSPATWSALN